ASVRKDTSCLAGAAEAAVAARRRVQFVYRHYRGFDYFLQDELRDAVAAMDEKRLAPVGVEQDDNDLAAIARINQSRRVDAIDAVTRRQPTAHHDEACVAARNRYGDARRNPRARARFQCVINPAWQIKPGIALVLVARHRQPVLKQFDLQLNHAYPLSP